MAVCITLAMSLLYVLYGATMKVEKSYRDQHPLQQFVIDKNSGEIFIGGQNTLVKLSPDLTLVMSVKMGPKMDSPLCPPPQIPCNKTKNSINSFTKGLVIDYEKNNLIVCSNLYQGSCEIRLLQNIAFLVTDIHKPIVGHIPESSDVLFIGPGMKNDVLYVGSKYNNINPGEELKVYRDMVPHISSRELDKLEFSYRDENGGTKISLLDEYRMDFQVNFVYGFTHNEYVYFITKQAKSIDDNTIQTKIIRICQKDKYFHSYVEIPLLCYKDKNEPYIVSKGAFFEETSAELYVIYEQIDQNTVSALCRYKMADITMLFDTTVEQCQKGSGYLGPSHIHHRTSCTKSNDDISLCGEGPTSNLYSSIEGVNPISEETLAEFPDVTLTSVLASKKDLNEIIFLGSNNGQLLKLIVSPGNQVTVAKEISVDIGQPITKLDFSLDKSKVYALTSNKILMVNPQHCDERMTCEECSVGQDPVCGWCVMENRCTEADSCPVLSVVPHWLMQTTCAKMVEIQPTSLSYETLLSDQAQNQIQFKLESIMLAPHSGDLNLQCSFVSMTTESKTSAEIENDIIKCPLPDQLPVIPKGKDYHDLEVEFHIEGRPIVKRSVPLYDCRVHVSCSDCTKSNFSCMWRYQDHTCISTTTNTASRQTTGLTNADECPRVESPTTVSEIMVHSGETKQIAVKVINLKTEQRDNIMCSFKYLSVVKVVPGSISSSSLTCDPVQFNFSSADNPSVIAQFTITWGQENYVLDNPTGISVRIFKCPLLVTNCGQCLSLQPEYECGWCGNYCSLQKHCNATWQDRSAICQNPQILRFSPSTGPFGGKTNVSISGINLGKTAMDIQSGVMIAGVRCTVLPEHYQPSFMFKCETEPAGKVGSGPVKVTVGNKYTTVSESNFSFVEPQVLFLTPREGPRSGGTLITIGGTDLNAGTSVMVSVGGSPCEVDSTSMNTLTCMTSAQTGNDESEIEVNFGGYKRLLSPKFTYVKDPEIQDILPKKSILSGGTKIDVTGSRLNVVQNAEFFVEVKDKKISTKCKSKDIGLGITYWLTCTTPRLSFPGEKITFTNPKDIHYGFNLDGVTIYRNLSLTKGPLEYYPDPEVNMFEGDNKEIKYRKDVPIVIQGNFQSIQELIRDTKVFIGRSECTNIFTTHDTLNCTPPVRPEEIDEQGNARVYVEIGNFYKEVGYLSYYEPESGDKPIAMGIILGVVIPITAIILLLAFCIIKRQRKNGPTKNAIPDMLKDYDTVKEEEDIGLLSVKADLNGQIPNNDSGPYISELLSRITDEGLKQNISTFLISRSQLDIGEVIGKGYYGNTYKADYKISEDEDPTQVAIKVLQGFPSDTESVDGFVQHMVTFKDIQHTNVLPYLGLCLGAVEDPILVSSYLTCTDLKSHVRDISKNLTLADLLEISQQIIEGMVYLQSHKIVHGNLAARNCLLTNDNKVLLSDYGYGELFSAEFYLAEDEKRKQIIKWFAQECLENGRFSSKSDVWSFGIVLWELLTRGVTPYPDVEPQNIRDYLSGGKRLKKPRQCPETLYLLMLQCWTEAPSERPTFHDVQAEVSKFMTKDEHSDITEPLTTKIEPGGSSEYLEVVS